MPQISRDEVAHLATLARLARSEEEITTFASQIDGIIGHVSAVQNVDTEAVEPMSHPHATHTAMRKDTVAPSLTQEQALDQAPEAEDDKFVVPQILGE